MNISFIIILLAAIANLIISFFVFLNDYRNRRNQLFFIFGFSTGLWVLTNFLAGVYSDIFWIKSAYSFGSIVATTGLFWILNLCEIRLNKLKAALLVIFGLVFFIIPYFNNLIITDVKRIYLGGYEGKTGIIFPFYATYALIILGLSAYNLFISYKQSTGLKKTQLRYILIGVILWISITSIVSFILPLFGYLQFTSYDSPTSILFIIFTAYAITKHHLFNIKVIATEILTALMAIMLLVRIPLSKTTGELVFNLLFFHIFLVLGILLIRTVWLEIHRVQEIEKLNKEKLAAYDRIKAQADELKQANIDLKKLLATKSKFMDLVSHQLRTPTSAVKGMLSMLVEGGLTPEEREKFIKSTYEASEKLSIIIRDIISATSIESGRLELELEPTDLGSIINETIQEHRTPAEQKKLKVNIDIPEGLPLVTADKYWLKQVFNNLLDNAIFYTRQGEINVGVKNNSEDITVSIKDTGVGINPEDKKRLFEVFTRGEKSQQVHPDGSGLGLYIAKNIINFHRGAINIFSEGQGQGTMVEVVMPKG